MTWRRWSHVADMPAYDHVIVSSWFCGRREIADVMEMGNLRSVREMQHTFISCDDLAEIGLSRLVSSSLEDLAHTFGGCESLVSNSLSRTFMEVRIDNFAW